MSPSAHGKRALRSGATETYDVVVLKTTTGCATLPLRSVAKEEV